MKTKYFFLGTALCGLMLSTNSCQQAENNSGASGDNTAAATAGQSGVKDDQSQKDVVKVAAGSPDHTTLVKSIQAAELVDALSNAGPFTVFAPTNAAFDKLPAGTLDDLLKPEKKEALQNILQYHVTVSKYDLEKLHDGQKMGMVNGDNAVISVKNGKYQINGANIIGTVQASNGIIHVIDAVMLPPAK